MSPREPNELANFLSGLNARAEKVPTLDLRQMNRVLELAPADMTVTVEAGLTLGELQLRLAQHRQWLPIDPPNPHAVTIHEILSHDLSGPRRFGYGTIREHLLGMKIALADGRIIKSGGKVVKNVAGYDLAKLFIGARDSLGVIVEATFKLRPLPEAEQCVVAQIPAAALPAMQRAVLSSPITPVIFDAHPSAESIALVLGFAGTRAEVAWQQSEAEALGFKTATTLDYDMAFWANDGAAHRLSVLPSRLADTLAELEQRPWLARAGNGIIYYRGEALRRAEILPRDLMRRVKAAYDAKNILPEFIA